MMVSNTFYEYKTIFLTKKVHKYFAIDALNQPQTSNFDTNRKKRNTWRSEKHLFNAQKQKIDVLHGSEDSSQEFQPKPSTSSVYHRKTTPDRSRNFEFNESEQSENDESDSEKISGMFKI